MIANNGMSFTSAFFFTCTEANNSDFEKYIRMDHKHQTLCSTTQGCEGQTSICCAEGAISLSAHIRETLPFGTADLEKFIDCHFQLHISNVMPEICQDIEKGTENLKEFYEE
ncbi:unnamed protein product [Heterobilharzia americana]|nr:unnamed protein product [Heterobilharzia americana]